MYIAFNMKLTSIVTIVCGKAPFAAQDIVYVYVFIFVPWLLNWTNQITQLEVDKSNIDLIR